MKKVIFATGNEGKMKEIREILGDLDIELLSLKDAGITADIEENGSTFEENAIIKAKAISQLTGEIVLADDSGLEIDYLNKESVMKKKEKTASAMTPSFIFRNTAVLQQRSPWKKKTRSATEGRLCALLRMNFDENPCGQRYPRP